MTQPAVSDAGQRIYDAVAAYHEGDEAAGWPLLHLCEALAQAFRKPTEVLRHDDLGSGWRRTMDPDRAAAWTLSWLAQFVGTQVPPQITTSPLRAMIRDAPGLLAGSLPALIGAGRAQLDDPDTGILHVLEREGSAYRLTVATYTAHCANAAAFEAAVRAQKAIGLLLTVTVTDGWIVGVMEDDDDHPTVGDLEDDFATVADLEDHIS